MKINVVGRDGNSREFDLDKEIGDFRESHFSLWIGRAKSCYVVVDDISISREHAELKYIDSKWIIKSDKRIMVNGMVTSEKDIKHGDVITLGVCSLSVYDEKITEKKELEKEATEDDEVEIDENSDHGENVQTEGDNFEEKYDENEEQEGESFDSEYEMAEVDEDGTKIIQGFSKIELDIFGESAPYDTYTIEKKETVIGRNPDKCEIVLSDPEVSGVHAVIKKSLTKIILEDMNSGNGILLNGERINKKELINGDEFIIGSTTFTVRVESDFIENERLHLMPVEDNQFVEVEEEVEFDENDMEEKENDNVDESLFGKARDLLSKDALRNPDKRKKILYIVVGLLLFWLLFDSPKENSKIVHKKTKKEIENKKKEKVLDPAVLASVDSLYQLAVELFETGKYKEAIFELDKIFLKISNYKKSRLLYRASKDALKEIELMKKKERELKELVERKKKVKKLLEKAESAIKDRKVNFAEQLFAQISQLDPENVDVVQMKIEIEHYKKEQERKAVEKAAKEAERLRQEKAISLGKKFYVQKKWHLAILEFESVIEKEKKMDKDLMDEVDKMLSESKNNLDKIIKPFFGKAKLMIEAKDLKGAYENYLEILKHEPGNIEALNEMSIIKEKLKLQSRKVYREAIISESLSLFDYAKEKFQEVQQISPVDSEYYKKSTEKLKNYLE